MYALLIIVNLISQPVYTHEVVIDGQVYAYQSTATAEQVCTAEDYIVTVSGEKVYISDLITAEEVSV